MKGKKAAVLVILGILLAGCTGEKKVQTEADKGINTNQNQSIDKGEDKSEDKKQEKNEDESGENAGIAKEQEKNETGETVDPEGDVENGGISEETMIPDDGVTFLENPIIRSIYSADPAPMVYGDTLYLYTSHDEDVLENDFYTMKNWYCFSTRDMVHWTEHGEVFSLKDIGWADDRAWAPQAVERNGKFYLYCPVHKRNGGMAIAVGVSDSPTGPFRESGFAVVDEGDWNDIDPTVFVDDDGQAYLYFGNPELRYVLLLENMRFYDKKVGVFSIPMTEESFGKGSQPTGTTYAEGPWFYKRNGIYYMVYAAFAEGKGSEHLAYSTALSPTGPWKYGGVIMDEEGGTFTNHPGVVDFKGHSYLFYHTADLPGGNLFHRSVCVAEFTYNEDGSIDKIEKCAGVNIISQDKEGGND